MALSGTNRGTNANLTAGTTVNILAGANFTSGSLAVLALAYDNSVTGGADPYSSITDNAGNTWTSRLNVLNDPGAANAGSTLRIFTTTVGTLSSTSVVTVTFSTSTTAKAWTFTEFTSNTGVASYSSGNSATGSSTTPTINSSSIDVNTVIFGAMANEGNSAITADSDTTNGNWSTQQTSSIGNATGAMQIASQYKIVNATGTQTYNPTLANSGDWCIGWINIIETAAAESYDPFGMMGIFGI